MLIDQHVNHYSMHKLFFIAKITTFQLLNSESLTNFGITPASIIMLWLTRLNAKFAKMPPAASFTLISSSSRYLIATDRMSVFEVLIQSFSSTDKFHSVTKLCSFTCKKGSTHSNFLHQINMCRMNPNCRIPNSKPQKSRKIVSAICLSLLLLHYQLQNFYIH